ncbi:hypothetical protein [Hymenobacter sp.]|uniref:hypothetical protein n=1 Tax=Hymenobacter sp. TaxID=1898978 RepID=UPI00286B9793|nr:hypothetical protein [Hymenobacter sp.]
MFASEPYAAPGTPLPGVVASGCAFLPAVAHAAAWPPPSSSTSQFVLGQNHPNPYVDETAIPFALAHPADVRLTLLDPLGRRVAVVIRNGLAAGEHSIALNLRGAGLPAGDYAYQLRVTNQHGEYHQRKTMTAR